MDAESIAEFNEDKAATLSAQTPAQVSFNALPGRVLNVSFGEKENDGQLHQSGQAIEAERVGFVFVRASEFEPKPAMTFKVVVCRQRLLVGRRYRILSPIVALPNEPMIKCGCVRIEE